MISQKTILTDDTFNTRGIILTMNLTAAIKLARPLNSVMAAVATSLGYWVSRNSLGIGSLFLLAATSAAALCFGNIINDYFDVEGDRINHPNRPLPSGLISLSEARFLILISFFIPPTLAFFVSPLYSAATLPPLLILVLYTVFLKGTPLAGNITVSLLTAYTLYFGGLTASGVRDLLYPAMLAFVLSLTREIVKDLEDRDGDILAGAKTTALLPFPVVKGLMLLCSISYLFFLAAPYFSGSFGKVYLYIAVLFICPVHCVILFKIFNAKLKVDFSRLSTWIKIEMILGLAAIGLDFLINNHIAGTYI